MNPPLDSTDDARVLPDLLRDEARRTDGGGSGSGGDHLDPDTLVAYHAGSLKDDEAARTRSHLVSCRVCSGLLLDLDQPFEAAPETTSQEVADFERTVVWKALHDTLEPRRPATEHAAAQPSDAHRWRAWAFAAALLLAAAGLGWTAFQLDRTVRGLERQIAVLETPVADVPILYLDAATRDAEDDARTVPAGAPVFVLVLTPDEPEAFERYQVTIEAADGVRLELADLPLSDYGTLRVAVPRGALGPGPFDVTLSGTVRGEQSASAIARYVLHVAQEP